jgi:DNA-binding response OmpR family regulator
MSHILLVDDDPDILNVLGATFETAGHDIVTTTDPLSIDGLLEAQSFDAVVLDVMMPRRSGWEVLERLRQDPSTQGLPVVLLSAVGDPSNRVRGIRLGADDFLSKPFDPEEVLVRVEGLLARRQPGQGNFQGNLSTISLAEVLQTLQQTRASGTLEITGPTGRGEIQLLDGLIRGAQFGRWLGADAVSTLLTLKAGSFRLLDEPGTAPTLPRPINFQGLLLDAAWVEDELERRQSHQPGDDQPLRRTTQVLGTPPEMPSVPIDWVMASIVERPGATLAQLIEDAPGTASRVRLAVAWLLEAGVLHRQAAHPSAVPPANPPANPADDNRPADGSGSWAAIGDPDLGDLLAATRRASPFSFTRAPGPRSRRGWSAWHDATRPERRRFRCASSRPAEGPRSTWCFAAWPATPRIPRWRSSPRWWCGWETNPGPESTKRSRPLAGTSTARLCDWWWRASRAASSPTNPRGGAGSRSRNRRRISRTCSRFCSRRSSDRARVQLFSKARLPPASFLA